MVLPRASITDAPAGTVTFARGPMAAMRPPVTTIVAVLDDLVAAHGHEARAGERDAARRPVERVVEADVLVAHRRVGAASRAPPARR